MMIPRQFNFNSLLTFIALCAIGWVGTTLQSSNDKLAHISERMAIIETANTDKLEQLNRIEQQLQRQQAQINDMSIELARIKARP